MQIEMLSSAIGLHPTHASKAFLQLHGCMPMPAQRPDPFCFQPSHQFAMLREEHAHATSPFSQEDLSAPSKLTAHAFEDRPHAAGWYSAGPGTAGGLCSSSCHHHRCPLTLSVCLRCIALFTCMPLLLSTGSVCFTVRCVCDLR